MSNKTIFQEKNTRLSANNTDLTSILNTINNLPSSSGSGSTEIEDGIMTDGITDYCNDRITITSQYCMAGRTNLKTVKFSNVKELQTRAFFMCSKLERAEFDKVDIIRSGVFYGTSALKTIILRSSLVVNLVSSDNFTGSAIASGTGYVYVPDTLVNSYKSATNWSTYASQIKGLSEL